MPQRRDSEQKIYRDKDPLWGMSGASHTLGAPVPGFGKGKMVGWRTGRKAVGSLDSTQQDCTCAYLLLKQGRKGRLKPRRFQ